MKFCKKFITTGYPCNNDNLAKPIIANKISVTIVDKILRISAMTCLWSCGKILDVLLDYIEQIEHPDCPKNTLLVITLKQHDISSKFVETFEEIEAIVEEEYKLDTNKSTVFLALERESSVTSVNRIWASYKLYKYCYLAEANKDTPKTSTAIITTSHEPD